jgi:hypothetical protein
VKQEEWFQALTMEDLLWLMSKTFDGYRIDDFVNRYHDLKMASLPKTSEMHMHWLREQNRIWELQRREAYMQRNKNKSIVEYPEDFW